MVRPGQKLLAQGRTLKISNYVSLKRKTPRSKREENGLQFGGRSNYKWTPFGKIWRRKEGNRRKRPTRSLSVCGVPVRSLPCDGHAKFHGYCLVLLVIAALCLYFKKLPSRYDTVCFTVYCSVCRQAPY